MSDDDARQIRDMTDAMYSQGRSAREMYEAIGAYLGAPVVRECACDRDEDCKVCLGSGRFTVTREEAPSGR